MSEGAENVEFTSSEELLQYLREHCDDIEHVVIPVQAGVNFTGPQGQRVRRKNVGAVLRLCTGRNICIHREDAAMLINDGVLQRMKIKCILDTLERT